jgi:act minimal PKS ketosynthase (KS/KS alpha)
VNARRVVVTGIGMVVPGAVGREAAWDMLIAGHSATRTVSFFDPSPFRSQMAAECDFDATAAGLSPQEQRRMDRAAQFAVACAREAVADAGLDMTAVDRTRTGVSIGSAVGCTTSLEREYVVVSDAGRLDIVDPAYAVPNLYDFLVPSSLAVETAWAVEAEGPVAMISTGCTSGIDAVGQGSQLITSGRADLVIAGATDAPISPVTVACFDAIHATSPSNDDPEHASRPFDLNRNGFVLGEGAAVLVLEELGRAQARGAHAYAEFVGYSSRANATHMTGLRPDGREMAEAIRNSLHGAGLAAESIDYINAHGSGTQQNDVHETAAFKDSLGRRAYEVPVSSIKSMVGHSLGAIGSIEVAACALATERSVVPPTANLTTPDPKLDLDYVPIHSRKVDVGAALCVGSGFGGFQSAAVLART